MDSHDSPRSLVPARPYPASPPVGPLSWSAPVAPPSAPSPQLVTATVRGIRRYWWLLLGLWPVLSILICAVIYNRVQPLYESETYLEIRDKTDIYGGGRNDDLAVFQDTVVQLIMGTNVLLRAASDPDVRSLPRIRFADDPVAELRNSLIVRANRGTYLITIGMASRDAQEAATIINVVIKAFMEENRTSFRDLTEGQIERLRRYLAPLNSKSEELKKRWMDMAKTSDPQIHLENLRRRTKSKDGGEGKDGDSTIAMTIEQFHRVEDQYREIQLELATAEDYLRFLREKKPEPKMTAEDHERLNTQISRIFVMDPDAVALQNQMFDVKDKLDNIKRLSPEGLKDPSAHRRVAEFTRLKAQYENLWAHRKEQIRDQLMNRRDTNPLQELNEAEAKVRDLRIRSGVLEKELANLKFSNASVSSQVVEVALIREELESISQMRETIQKKIDDLDFSTEGGDRLREGPKAKPAGRARADSRLKYMAMTPVGVFAAVLCLVIALELRSARVSDPESLSARLRHEVFPIAPLPNMRPGQDARAPRAEQKLARFVQSLDHLRAALCEGGMPGQGRCVLITSATGGEGKTTLSAHLAARCANAGTSILLIDADMRRGSLGRLLDVVDGMGLADVLNGDVSLVEAIRPVQAGGFAFLSAGTTEIDPSRILTTSRLSALVEQLRVMYDLILIDSPPILPVPDALLMGRHVDGVVMASRFDSSRLPMVERASRQLAAANIPVLGMVVNGARGHASAYDNYHYNYPHPAGRAETEPVDEPV